MSTTSLSSIEPTRTVTSGAPEPCPKGTETLPERRPGAPRAEPAVLQRLAAFPVWGTVIHAATAYPLADVVVRARSAGECSTALLGEGHSDADGGFRIRFIDNPCVHERLLLLQLGRATCSLEVEWSRETSVPWPCPVSGATAMPLILRIALGYSPMGAETWADIAHRLMQHRIAQLSTLARALIDPAEVSLFGDLDLETRHSALIELEQAFLDPEGLLRKLVPLPTFYQLHGGGMERLEAKLAGVEDKEVQAAFGKLKAKVATYRDLLEVHWTIDLNDVAKGMLGRGIDKFGGVYADDTIGGLEKPVLGFASDTARYRNYLRTLFTGGTKSATYAPNLGILKNRFHQDFETNDSGEQPANEILIPIVQAALTAPTAEGSGFGVPAASIQPRGSKTAREYLDYLIGLAQVTAEEFGRRYRIDLKRNDAALSTPLQENIATLQRFFADSFQDAKEPSPAVPDGLYGRAPFFLYYEEWLSLEKPFFPENVYRPALTFSAGIEPEARAQVKSKSDGQWSVLLLEIEDDLAKAVLRLDQSEFGLARDALLAIDAKAQTALAFAMEKLPGKEKINEAAVSSYLEKLKAITVKTPSEFVHTFISFYRIRGTYKLDTDEISPYDKFYPWLNSYRIQLWVSLVHLRATVIPTLLGDCALGTGDYALAIDYYRHGTHRLIARAQLENKAGYPASKLDLPKVIGNPAAVADWEAYYEYHGWASTPAFYSDGGLPYTVDLNQKRTLDPYDWWVSFTLLEAMAGQVIHQVEQRYLKLRQGQAMLEWADALYRSDEPSNIQRARELYKSVLWLHGSKPPSVPRWGGSAWSYQSANPAQGGQKARARLGIEQIEAGLNWYGANDSLIPALRYRPLKEAADRYAAAARSAQQDFLLAMGKLEDAIRESLVNTNLLKKAALQEKIAKEQEGIAEFGVVLAQQQVAAVEAQIAAKKQEIADHDSLGGQFGDLFSGMSSIVGKIPAGVTEKVGTGVSAGAGLSASEAAGMSAAAGGAAVLGAMAAFVIIGVMTLDSMADAQLSRHQQLNALKEKALPLAKAGVDAKQREVTIAQYQQQIAAADIELAKSLIQFQQSRFLNEKLWAEIAAVMRRVMRRYLSLGGRYAWLAERALAFEQDRPLDIVRFDYFPAKLQGVTGADLLQADLAELDAARLDGIRQTVPVKRTYSLLADFPLQFAELKNTGRCTFLTREEPFRHAYPGTYGYRVRAVTVTPRSYAGIERPRGLLTNLGVSVVSRSDGSTHALLRPQEAQPLSEFRLMDDMAVYGLPDEALLVFEGSGVETVWQLSLPSLANRLSLDDLSDIELTFDLRAQYSPQLHAAHLAAQPASVRRLSFFSARAFAGSGLDALRDPAQPAATVVFDIPAIGRLSRLESNRQLRNVVLMVPGADALDFAATFTRQGSAPVPVSLVQGIARSNAEPLGEPGSQEPPSPLNVLAGGPVDTSFQLAITKGANAAAFGQAQDVLLGIEYTATLA